VAALPRAARPQAARGPPSHPFATPPNETQTGKSTPETITKTVYVEVPVPNSADSKAWRVAKERYLVHNPNKPIRAVELFREMEQIKELALSGDPTGTLATF
jgi:hypothetical protein